MTIVAFSTPCSFPTTSTQTSALCTTRSLRCRLVTPQSVPRCSAADFPAPTPGDNVTALAQDIAISFVTACAGSRVPYSEAVRNFVALSLDAYTRGISLSALRLELRSNGLTPRPLASDEAELRDVWLALVYKTLKAVRFPGAAPSSTMNVPDQFDAFVKSVVAARRGGSDLPRIQLAQAITSGNERSSPLESAILRQSTRLVVATLEEADERREKAKQDVPIDGPF